MSSPYIGEIRMFGGNFPPNGWAFCDGQTMAISDNPTLFQLIGTTYGGDGQSTFNLPDLRSRVPIHMGTFAGSSFISGETAGVETVTLNTNQITTHNHPLLATGSNQVQVPNVNAFPASVTPSNDNLYGPAGSQPSQFAASTIGNAGGNQPHNNIQPFQAINFIISLFGIFPSQN
jgi:microcystin-dependent protein